VRQVCGAKWYGSPVTGSEAAMVGGFWTGYVHYNKQALYKGPNS